MDYDVIIAGGGLAGSGLAKVLSDDGMKVLVLERETQFQDRVRGEVLLPWGVLEAQKLGMEYLFDDDCVLDIPNFNNYANGQLIEERNLIETTPGKVGFRHFHHPEMQDIFIDAARGVQTELRRGVTVTGIQAGEPPSITFEADGKQQTLQARLIVLADGKNSKLRKQAGFELNVDSERLVIAGTMYTGLPLSNDTAYNARNPSKGLEALLFPLAQGRTRCYVVYNEHGNRIGLSGKSQHTRFQQLSIEAGFPSEWFDNVKPIGILAEFQTHSRWVDHPYKEGIVLLGDAASSPDPTYGEGMSLVLRGIRILREQLATHEDWDLAGHAYATEQNRDFMKLRQLETFFTDWLMETGEEADTRRARVASHLEQIDPRALAIIGYGPDVTFDETVRDFLFAPETIDN